jgi:hypothetical protein
VGREVAVTGEWRKLETLKDAFAHLAGRTVLRGTSDYRALPSGGSFVFWEDLAALEFDDGSWLAVEVTPPEEGYSEYTPGSDGMTVVAIYTPACPATRLRVVWYALGGRERKAG